MTEELLGPIADGWRYLTLGEVCRLGGGDIQTGPFGSQLHASDYVADGIPSIMPVNIGDNRISDEKIARVSEDDAERLKRYRVQVGDIIYSRRGDVERRSLIREREDGWLCGTGCLRVRIGRAIADPEFTAQYLGHPAVREWIVRHAHGATMPNLNTSILAACPFVLPPMREQERLTGRCYPRADRTGDQHDAFSIAAWLSQANRDGSLAGFLQPDLAPQERVIAQVEGWILGVSGSSTQWGNLATAEVKGHA